MVFRSQTVQSLVADFNLLVSPASHFCFISLPTRASFHSIYIYRVSRLFDPPFFPRPIVKKKKGKKGEERKEENASSNCLRDLRIRISLDTLNISTESEPVSRSLFSAGH